MTEEKTFLEWLDKCDLKTVVPAKNAGQFMNELKESLNNQNLGIPNEDHEKFMTPLKDLLNKLDGHKGDIEDQFIKYQFINYMGCVFTMNKNVEGVDKETGKFDIRNVMKGGYIGSVTNTPSLEIESILKEKTDITFQYLDEIEVKKYSDPLRSIYQTIMGGFAEHCQKRSPSGSSLNL